jgi:ubiquinone biosynthesis protein UbiJ
MDTNRPLDEVLDELRRVFSEQEIDRLLRQATIRQQIRDLQSSTWEEAQPAVVELLRVLAHLVASVETLWATVARLEQRLDRLYDEEEGDEWES